MSYYYKYYSEFPLHIDELILYYKNNLFGHNKLRGEDVALKISEKLDLFINLSPEEQEKFSFSFYTSDIQNKLISTHARGLDNEKIIHLKTKLACAYLIKFARIIEIHQKKIWNRAKYITMGYSGVCYQANYSVVPDSLYEDMHNSIYLIKQYLDRINRMNLENDFRESFFKEMVHTVEVYSSIFRLGKP